MGWITDRRNTTGFGIAHGHQATARTKAPLRKIIEVVKAGDRGMFSSGDWVRLECGHECFSKGISNARCRQCAKQQSSSDQQNAETQNDSQTL